MASLFSKPNSIVYLRRSGLIVAGRQIKPARLNFPAGVVSNLEVRQQSKFIRGCQAFFSDQHVKGKRVLVVLDQSLVFEKVLSDTGQSLEDSVDSYLAAMPFDPGKRAAVQFNQADGLHIYASNYEIYHGVAEALDAAGVSKIIAITPAAAYNLPVDQKLATAIEQFITDTTIHREANFNNAQAL